MIDDNVACLLEPPREPWGRLAKCRPDEHEVLPREQTSFERARCFMRGQSHDFCGRRRFQSYRGRKLVAVCPSHPKQKMVNPMSLVADNFIVGDPRDAFLKFPVPTT